MPQLRFSGLVQRRNFRLGGTVVWLIFPGKLSVSHDHFWTVVRMSDFFGFPGQAGKR